MADVHGPEQSTVRVRILSCGHRAACWDIRYVWSWERASDARQRPQLPRRLLCLALTRFFASVLAWKIDFRRIPQAAAQGTEQKGRGVSRALTWSVLRQVGDLGEG